MTTASRYGAAWHPYQPVTPGTALDIGLRLPLIAPLGGNTGSVAGGVTCGVRPAAMSTVTRVRAWSTGRGPDGGIEGYAAGADVLTYGATATTYRISYLEGGRCFAPSQPYELYMDVNCGGRTQTQQRTVNVVGRAGLTEDWAF